MGLKLIRTLAAQLRGTLTFATPPEGAGTADHADDPIRSRRSS